MRDDMDKVIVERPRGGRSWARARRKKLDKLVGDEAGLAKIGLKRAVKLTGNFKSLNENLSPLLRYLESQINRPWDKVWSEICKNLKPDNTVQQHVRDHVPDFVAHCTRLIDGEIWAQHRRFGSLKPLKETFVRLYVDPRTGILRRNPHWKTYRMMRVAEAQAREIELAKRMRKAGPRKQYHLLNDSAWWEITLAPIPTSLQEVEFSWGKRIVPFEREVRDSVISAGLSTLSSAELYDQRGVYAVSKRQLSGKEMRDLGLR